MGILFIALAVLGVMYMMNAGPFKNEIAGIQNLKEKFCNEKASANKCDCIVKKLEIDIRERFSSDEIKELEDNKLLMLGAAIKSFKAQEEAIDACLEVRNASHEKEEFIKQVFDQKGFIGKAKGVMNDFVEDYKLIEDKY